LRHTDRPSSPGQHDVEHDHVIGIRDREVQARDAVGRVVDGEAAVLEEIDDRAGDVAVILDQQHVRLSGLIRHGLKRRRAARYHSQRCGTFWSLVVS
jgi:hypothetical protein